MSKRILSMILLCSLVLLAVSRGRYVPGAEETSMEEIYTDIITVWYTDEETEGYLKEAAIAYQEQTGIKVALHQAPGLEYLEGIHEATLHGDNGPDAYIVNSDSLEKARLSGLASDVEDPDGVLNTEHFPQVALNAVTYNGNLLGYPFTYETAALFYNENYLTEMAEKAIIAERGGAQDDGAGEEIEISEADLEAKKAEILPTSMIEILEFANSYEPAEGMDSFLLWDVADIMYNYGFAGAYTNVGGEYGDDRENINIYNQDAMYCLSVYQDFNQFFSIDTEEVDYKGIVEDFANGKIMFTIAGTDLLNTLEAGKADGTYGGEYGITSIEMLNATLQYKPLSVTTAVVINEYSEKQEAAEDFAQFVTCEYINNLYARSGKMCAYYLEEYPVGAMRDMMRCYENSVSLPKIVENSNYWILAELCYTNIWAGADVNVELVALSQQVKKEISGEEVEENKIPTPEVKESYIAEE